MSTLAFVLEGAAVLAIVGGASSLLVWPLLTATAQSRSPSAAARADAAFILGTVPAIAALTAFLAAAAPSLRILLTGAGDHCATHSHHLHLCIVHASALRPALAAIGALFLALFAFRGALRIAAWREERALLTALEAMGTRRPGGVFPVVTVPGSPWLCVAAGVLRPRIILSATLEQRLDAPEMQSALAHERAHLRRRDPLANLLLGLAGLLSFPWVARAAADAYRAASEEASDALAAQEVGDSTAVASALLKVAAYRRSVSGLQAHAAFGEQALERRVRRLLSASGHGRATSWALPAAFALSAVAVAAGLLNSSALHHAVETVLHHFS